MLGKILIILVVVGVAFVGIVVTRPSEFHVTRSLAMSAPASTVFAQVNDLHKWKAWSPWAKMDPNATETHEGPVSGTGSIMRWAGNMKVGEGSMTIVESHPNDLIRFRLEFLKPMAATNTAEFTFKPQGNQTLVTWSMSGHNNFIGKAMSLIMNCDKMVGDQFEQGLSQLAAVVGRRKGSA
jgi:uncharacterized protein YndB with AHSA1/START domain